MKKKQKYEVPRTRARCYFFARDLTSTHEMYCTEHNARRTMRRHCAELKPLHAALKCGFTIATNLVARNEVPPSERQITFLKNALRKVASPAKTLFILNKMRFLQFLLEVKTRQLTRGESNLLHIHSLPRENDAEL